MDCISFPLLKSHHEITQLYHFVKKLKRPLYVGGYSIGSIIYTQPIATRLSTFYLYSTGQPLNNFMFRQHLES